MTTTEYPHKLRKVPIFTPYVVMWSTLGVLSLGLLMVLGLAPDWLGDLKPASGFANQQSNQGQRAAAHVAAELNALKQSVAQVQLDLSKVQTEMLTQGEQQKSVTAQLSSLAARMPEGASVVNTKVEAAPAPAPTAAPQVQTLRGYSAGKDPAPAAVPPVEAQSAVAQPPVADVVPTAPPAASAAVPRIINADATAGAPKLETGSLNVAPTAGAQAPAKAAATQAISFGPATVKPAPKPVGIKVSTGDSVDSLRLSWSLLSEKHGDALKNMQPRVVASGDPQNPTYDLVAGPVKSKAEANKVCKSLAAQGVPCTIGAFAGDSL
jgi:SPOR domain